MHSFNSQNLTLLPFAKMKLHVQVTEARNLAARDANGLSDPFVRLQLGNTKTKTSVVMRNLNPAWHEEFFFNVVESDEVLLVVVWDEDRFTDDFLGQVKIPVSRVLTAEKQTISREWFTLQKRSEKSKFPVTGAFCLSTEFLSVFSVSIRLSKIEASLWQYSLATIRNMVMSGNVS